MTTPAHIHRPGPFRLLPLCAIAASGLALLLGASPARASEAGRLGVDWGKLALVLQTPPALLFPHGSTHAETFDPDEPAPWVGAEPRLSLVARDWAGSRQLVGDLALTDELRPSHSSRMVVSRVKLAEGRVAPFAQLGLGEWRVDTSMFPTLPREHVLAGQAGLGFELSLSADTVVAFETGWTFLESQNATDVVAQTHPVLFSTNVAARTRF